MKPETLILKNIGPFVGIHKIDFTALDSIFLVCGKTGAGKTTILDSISYAFYSKAQGGRSQITKLLRSQFASETETAEVELIFLMDNIKYKIIRRLPFLKPDKKKETPEEVQLAQYKNNHWTDITSTNKSETDKKILNIIKLKEKEFSRIVLLPQGEFANFLKENSKDKKESLAQLFPISLYSQIMTGFKEKAKENENAARLIQKSLEDLENEFDFNSYDRQKQELEEELANVKKNYMQISNQLQQKNRELEQSKILTEKTESYIRQSEKLKNLNLHNKDFEDLKIKIEKARNALSLSSLAESVINLQKSISNYKNEIENKNENLQIINKIICSLENEKPEIENYKQKKLDLQKIQINLERAKSVYSEIENKQIELNRTVFDKSQITNQFEKIKNDEEEILTKISGFKKLINDFDIYKENYEKAYAEFNYLNRLEDITIKREKATGFYKTHTEAAERVKLNLETVLKDIEIEKNLLQELKNIKHKNDITQKAAALAVELQNGLPCPVCGSLHHPQPAVENNTDVFSIEEKIKKSERAIDRFSTEKANLDKSYTERKKDSERYKDELTTTEKDFIKLNSEFENFNFVFTDFSDSNTTASLKTAAANALENAAKKFKDVQTANSSKNNLEQQLYKIQNKKEEISSHILKLNILEVAINTALNEKQNLYNSIVEELPEDIKKTNIEDTIENSKTIQLEIERKINGYEERLAENILKQTKIESQILQQQRQLNIWEENIVTDEARLNEKLKQKGFSSINELISAIIPNDEISDIEKEIEKFNEEKISLTQIVNTLSTELVGKEFNAPETVEEEINNLQKKLDEEQARALEFTTALQRINDLFTNRKKLINELSTLTINTELLSELAADLNGDNKLKLKFDIWVLSAFLKEITMYANRRLEKMSGNRYMLNISKAVTGNNLSGLDLEIFDAYTGCTRPTTTLSGGETFIVSISLALGLADSIQARNGGIKLDSMFIDEGFGTLDETSLENAISILDEVRGNRMVGIISHVNELRQRIPHKIEIEKTENGSYIKESF